MPKLIDISDVVNGVVTLTLNRPDKKNALSIALRDEVADALDLLAGDPAVKVVAITGAGGVFSAGFDLSEFALDDPEHQRRLWASSDRFHHSVLSFPLPTVAGVNGAAIAGGFDLAVLCDLRVASDRATFVHVEHAFGDVVYTPLRELVGGSVARDLVLTGRKVSGAEALDLGLVNRVVPAEALSAELQRVGESIAVAPREMLLRTKAKIVARTAIAPTTRTLDL